MRTTNFSLTLLIVLGGLFALPWEAGAEGFAVGAFLKTHCLECHGTDCQEADLRFDTLSLTTTDPDAHLTWQRIVEAIESDEMPPAHQPRPAAKEVEAAVDEIVSQLQQAAEPSIALRRMNRREYENTVHDLLGIEIPLADLLPADGTVQGFNKGADGLTISSVLLEEYLKTANAAFDATIRRIKPLPPETRRAVMMEVKENIDSVDKKKGGTIEVDGSFVKFTPGWPPARIDPAHPIEDGIYRCRVAIWPHKPGERTISVALYVGSLFGSDTRKFIGIFDATGTPDDPRIVEFTTFMNEGDTIHIVPRVWPEHVTWRDKHEPRPGVGIAWAETHGPLDQSFPSEATKKLFGDVDTIFMKEEWPVWMRHRKNVKNHVLDSTQPEVDARRVLRDFLPRAFRRPVSDAEMRPYVQLTLDRLEAGRSFEEAMRSGITAVLCSPQFLLLNREPVVDDYTIASRLSYFLWLSTPDEELLRLAAEGTLSDPQVRREQVERMIADPRIERFVSDFTGQWLDLDYIELTTPDQKLYPEFDPLLQEAMLGETRHFFRHILTEDLSVMNFIDSDWTFLNQRLASHYGIEGIAGHEKFRQVTLPEESIRGGVLTHASLHKVTGNGTTTSPVHRGVWVLDNLLGRPAPPPPPGVPAVEPDIRGATTVRELFAAHREIGTCISCHKRIDPPGFALEEFDAIGGHRTWYRSLGEGEKVDGIKTYRQGPDVESSEKFADGREFSSFVEFREQLLQKDDQVARAVATKLLVYATGRPIHVTERDAVRQVVARARENDLGLKSMIHAVAESDLFLAP